eukprot:gene36222-37632_t
MAGDAPPSPGGPPPVSPPLRRLRVPTLFLIAVTTVTSTTVSLLGGWMVYHSSVGSLRDTWEQLSRAQLLVLERDVSIVSEEARHAWAWMNETLRLPQPRSPTAHATLDAMANMTQNALFALVNASRSLISLSVLIIPSAPGALRNNATAMFSG